MIKIFLSWLSVLPLWATAGPAFEGYDAYNNSHQNQLFKSEGVDLQADSEGDELAVRYAASISTQGRRHVIQLKKAQFTAEGHRWQLSRARPFPGETTGADDLGRGSTAYFSAPSGALPGWVCLESTPASAAGTAIRHKAVYLLSTARAKHTAWKLPSLFASCRGLRHRHQQILFDQIVYRYPTGQDEPTGLRFREYALVKGGFMPTGHLKEATFVEPGNVYRFTIDER